MPKVQPMPADCAAYIARVKDTVTFSEKNIFQSASNLVGGFGRIVKLNAVNFCSSEAIAQSFQDAVRDKTESKEDLSHFLSFLTEAQIKVVTLPYSADALDIVNMAIFQTKHLGKREALARLGIAIKAQEPVVQPPEPPAPEPEPTPEPTPKVKLPDHTKLAMDGAKALPTPTKRKEHLSPTTPSLTTDKLIAKEFQQYLCIRAGDMPFYNHVQALANLLDSTKDEKKVEKVLGTLNLLALLYLYEVMKEHLPLMRRMWVDSYMNMVPTDHSTAQDLKNLFRAYLECNKRDEAINGRYVELLEAVEEAELAALRGAATEAAAAETATETATAAETATAVAVSS